MIQQVIKKYKAYKMLLLEFNKLKNDLFGQDKFVVMDEGRDEVKRYNQLLQFFYPCYRTNDFVSPLN